MEIGQFFKMKYKVGITNKNDRNIIVKAELSVLGYVLSKMKPIITNKPIVKNIVKPKALGYESLRDLPSLLKKPFSLSKVIFVPLVTKYGTPSNVDHEAIKAPVGFASPNSPAIHNPRLIPSQNIRFQKLSLLRRDFMKFISVFKSNITSFILPRFSSRIKAISAFVVIFHILSAQIATADDLSDMISKAESKHNIPKGLLASIAKVESSGNPYALNISGRQVQASSKNDAIKIASSYVKQGTTNIDVGVMQINYHWHGENFESLEKMFTLENNIEYAAKLLCSLYHQHGSWNKAVRFYHSSKPEYYQKYAKKVMITWLNG
jgi:hypothetical protein